LYQVSRLKRILSYIVPVKIWKGSGTHNPVLELFLCRGEWQLSTEDAVYSDGSVYRPLVVAFQEIRDRLPEAREVLVLGAGLGSAVSVLDRLGFRPRITLVDIDRTVIDICSQQIFPDRKELRFYCDDAARFLAGTSGSFDVIIIDVFQGRIVPEFAVRPGFFQHCRSRLSPSGTLVMNYIVNDEAQWKHCLAQFSTVFPEVTVKNLGVNKVLIARV